MATGSQESEPEAASIWRLDRQSGRRSLILCGAGALLGLGIAGVGLFTAQGTHVAGVPAEDVAIVNNVPILLSDYISQLRVLYDVSLSEATAAQKRKVLDDMIQEEIYVQRAVELGLQNDVIEVRTTLVDAVKGQQAVDANSSEPGEAELKAFYAAHRDKYSSEGEIEIDDYLAPDRTRAEAAVSALRVGKPGTAVAARFGLRRSGVMTDGAEFYFAAKIHLGATLFYAVAKTPSGGIVGPIAIGETNHVMVVHSNQPPVAQPFPEVQSQTLNDYRSDRIARMQDGANNYLRQRADIQIAKGFE